MNNNDKLRQDKNERNGFTSFVLHKGTNSRGQRDCDRSSVRVFEERLASEQNCDWTSGTRDTKELFCQCIINAAKENNLFLSNEECINLGERIHIRSGESQIYENASQGLIYKVRDPFAKIHLKSDNLTNIIYEHIAHNLLFPNARYTLVGISEIQESLRFVYSQQLIFGLNSPSQQQIDNYLISMGLLPEDRYYYGNEFVSITDIDAKSDNVLIDNEGNLFFIDPIIKIKKSIDEIIQAYPFQKEQRNDSSNSFMAFIKKIFKQQ